MAASTAESIALRLSSGWTSARPKRQTAAGDVNRFGQRRRLGPVGAGERQVRKVVGARLLDAKFRRRKLRLGAADVRTALEQARRQSRRQLRHPGRGLDRRAARDLGGEHGSRRAARQRGERRLEDTDRLPHARDVGDDGGELGLGLAQIVFADDAALEAVALQRHGVGPRLARVFEHRGERVGGPQPEVRIGDVGGDRDAHGLAVIPGGGQVVGRGQGSAAILAPDVELVRHFDAEAEVVARAERRLSDRLRGALRTARARRASTQVHAGIQVRLRQQQQRACGLDARERAAQVEVVRVRLVDERRQHRVVERDPPALEQRVLRRGRGRGGQVQLRRRRLRDGAACQQRREE